MPQLPGPPDDYDAEQRRAWLDGAATIAELQADQWAIIANRYREELPDDPADDETCPKCGADLVDALGGAVCPTCTEET